MNNSNRFFHFSFALVLVVLSTDPARAQQTGSDAPEDSRIGAVVEEFYVEGLRTREFHLIRSICIPQAVMMGVRGDGSLGVTTLDEWSARFDPDHPPFRILDHQIGSIDRTGSAAQVRIDFVMDGREITDYLQMLLIGGEWKIVNIIDNG